MRRCIGLSGPFGGLLPIASLSGPCLECICSTRRVDPWGIRPQSQGVGNSVWNWCRWNCWLVATALRLVAEPTTNDFSGAAGNTPYATKTWGNYAGGLLQAGALRLTYAAGQSALVVFNRTANGPQRAVTADFRISATPGADGFSFHLLDTEHYGTTGIGPFGSMAAAPTPFEEPELANALSVGFDVYDPDDYQGLGAHEVSLHWDGVELAKRLCPVDYRTGGFVPVQIHLAFVPGGAEVTVKVSGVAVYTDEFIAGPVPFEARAAFGARTGGLSFTSRVDNVSVVFTDPYVAFAPAQSVRVFDRVWIHGGNRNPQKTTALPIPTRPWERVVLRLQLEKPPNGFDVYDRQMNLTVTSGGQTYELARFMTPFGQGGVWFADVTDFQSLLRGNTVFKAFIDTYVPQAGGQFGSGWLYTADLLFHAGEPGVEPYRVQNLWNGEPRYGDPTAPIATFFKPLTPLVDAAATRTKVRLMVTGHGQAPNADNAAEFLSRGRTLKVGTTPFANVLWRNDCYLNPDRPQPGTWQYSRAGWCPGSRVDPWVLDISALTIPGRNVALAYVAGTYANTTIDEGNPARQWVASQLITYRPGPTAPPTLAVTAGPTGASLRWPDWAHRHELYSSAVLDTDPVVWARVPVAPTVVGNAFVVSLPAAAQATFYILQAAPLP